MTPRDRAKKHLKRSLLALLIIFLIIVVDGYLKLFVLDAKPMQASTDKFITHAPFDLEQVIGYSKFRSCQGHDHSGKNTAGQLEHNRSMKHYIVPRSDITNELGTIKVLAPFDGKIGFVMPEGKGNQIIIYPNHDKKWGFLIFHVDLLEGVGKGSSVQGGQLLGYANVKDRHDFDIGLTRTESTIIFEKILTVVQGNPHFSLPKGNYYVSPFNYMKAEVIEDFRAVGLNMDEVEFSKEYRDSKPCDFDKAAINDEDWVYKPGFEPSFQMGPGQQEQLVPASPQFVPGLQAP